MSSWRIRCETKHAQRLFILVRFSENPIMSSCVKPLLEEAGFETWAVDILGWGFSDLEKLPSCDEFQSFWKSYIKRKMILVGPSLGSAVVIDFAVNYPEAVYVLKSIPLRVYANYLSFTNMSFSTSFDWTNVSCQILTWVACIVYCLGEDATVDFMISGGYNVASQIKKVFAAVLVSKDRPLPITIFPFYTLV
ncbi:hypothetical protein CR513_33061, partial [Mucuna pruriens]